MTSSLRLHPPVELRPSHSIDHGQGRGVEWGTGPVDSAVGTPTLSTRARRGRRAHAPSAPAAPHACAQTRPQVPPPQRGHARHLLSRRPRPWATQDEFDTLQFSVVSGAWGLERDGIVLGSGLSACRPAGGVQSSAPAAPCRTPTSHHTPRDRLVDVLPAPRRHALLSSSHPAPHVGTRAGYNATYVRAL
jgi:hypothetical protein